MKRALLAVVGSLALGVVAWGCGPALTVLGVVGLEALRDDDRRGPGNATPAVSVVTPTGTVNDTIPITYVITDPNLLDRANVTVDYAVGSGSFQPATQAFADGAEGTQNLSTSPSGASHAFLWSSAADLGWNDVPSVRVRVSVADASDPSLAGLPATTAAFAVKNRFLTTLARAPIPPGVSPVGLAVSASNGDLIIADGGGHRVVRVASQDGQVSVLAGTGEPGNNGTNLLGPTAQLNLPIAVTEAGGDILVADSFNGLLRRIDAVTGFISDVAGAGDVADDDYDATGVLARDASLAPRDVAVDAAGNPFVLSLDPGRVRALNTRSAAALTFPTGLAAGPLPPTVSLGPGRIMSIIAATDGNGAAVSGSAFLAQTLEEAAALAVWDDGATRLVYVLELGSQGNDSAELGVANFGALPLDFETPSGAVTVPSGEFAVLFDDLPTLREFADLALVAPQVLLLGSGGDGALYAGNASPIAVTVAGTLLAPGEVAVVVGKANSVALSADGTDPLDARLLGPFGVAVDAAENIFLSEANGRVRVVAGPSGAFTLGDLTVERGKVGTIPLVLPGTQASIVQPVIVSLGRDGDLLVTDSDLADPRSNRVLRVRGSDASVAGVAGTGVFGDSGDGGPADSARLGLALCAAQDPLRDVIVFADFIHARVRAVNVGAGPTTFLGVTIAPGQVETVAGTGEPTSSGAAIVDGPATSVTLRFPSLLAFDAQGLLWLSDTGDNVVRVANPTGAPVTVLGVTIAPDGLATVVGTGEQGTPQDDGDGGPALAARLSSPAAVLGADGNLWIMDGLRELQEGLEDPGNNGPGQSIGNDEARVRVVNLQPTSITLASVTIAPGELDTVIGAATPRLQDDSNLGDGGPAASATFREPSGLSVRSDGLVFISDSDDQRIRVVNVTSSSKTIGGRALGPGIIDTIVGTGVPGYSGDPSGVSAGYFGVTAPGLLDGPSGVLALDDGRLLFADSRNGAVRMANLADGPRRFAGIEAAPGGLVIIAGSRSGRVRVRTPIDVEVDDAGAVLFSDLGRFNAEPAVLSIDPQTRVVTRAVGTQVRTAFDRSNLGDGGPALLATLAEPVALDVTSDGSLYIADAGNRRIRFVNRAQATATPAPGLSVRPGDIDTLVNGQNDPQDLVPDDGQSIASPTSLTLTFPSSVARAAGALWIGDEGSDRVLRVNLTLGVVEGVVGALGVQGPRSCTVAQDGVGSDVGRLTDTTGPGLDLVVFAGDTLRFNGTSFAVVTEVVDADELLFSPAPNAPMAATYEVFRAGRPTALAAIDDDQVYVATSIDDLGGSRIVLLTRTGASFTAAPVAGTGTAEWNGDLLPALSMNLGEVRGLHLDGGLLFVGDSTNHRVVGVNLGLTTVTVAGLAVDPGNARTLAGVGQGDPGFNGDAVPAAAALLNQPAGVSLSPDGGLVFIDAGNARVRRFQR